MTNKEAIAELRDIYKEIDDVFIFTGDKKIEALDLAIEALRDSPRGEWLNVAKLTCQEYNGREYGECSICHKVREAENFCPHCGADMRGEI